MNFNLPSGNSVRSQTGGAGTTLLHENLQQNGQLDSKQLQDVFQEFKSREKNVINGADFVEQLERANMSESCSLLVSKIKDQSDKFLQEQTFYNLFNFDFTSQNAQSEENLNLVLTKFNEIANGGKENISLQELINMNTKYGLGLSKQDINVMIKYGGNPETESITVSDIQSLIKY